MVFHSLLKYPIYRFSKPKNHAFYLILYFDPSYILIGKKSSLPFDSDLNEPKQNQKVVDALVIDF